VLEFGSFQPRQENTPTVFVRPDCDIGREGVLESAMLMSSGDVGLRTVDHRFTTNIQNMCALALSPAL
jgi:hypothetical protein